VLTNETFRRYIYKASGTLFIGSMELKGGLDWEHLSSTYFQQYGGRDRLRLRLTAGGAYRNTQHRYYAKTPIGSNCVKKVDDTAAFSIVNCLGYNVADGVSNSPQNDNTAFFLQDSWKVLKNLTINAGIRYEQQSLKDEIGLSPIDIKNEWAPRIGVIWDFANNGKSKLYANYGRFYEVIPQDIQTRALGNEYIIFARNSTKDRVDPINTVSFPYAIVQGGEIVQDGLKGMYQDEVIGGLEYEIAPNWAIGVKGIYKALGTVVEDRCDVAINPDIVQFFKSPDQTCALINPAEGDALGTIKDPTDLKCYPNGYVDGDGNIVAGGPCQSTRANRYFRGIEFTAAHRFSNNFYVNASYLYSKLVGNYSGNLSQTREFGQADPNINADFDYPGLLINAQGTLKNNRTHQVKISGYYAFPFGLNTGLAASYSSGKPYSIRGCTPDPVACPGGYNQEGYLITRGTAGELPGITQADLHLEYAIRFGGVSVTPIVDIINVLNSQTEVSREELFNNTGDLDTNAPCADGTFSQSCAPNPRFGKSIQYQNPRVIRLGARVSF
jgi:outer membrane receptor protein involved in Fe transport